MSEFPLSNRTCVWRPLVVALLGLALAFSPLAKAGGDGSFLISNVDVFTGIPGKAVLKKQNVLIRGERIVKLSAEAIAADGATVIDGQGQTLLPGLIDFHTHVTGTMLIPWKMGMLPDMEFALKSALNSGITTVVDMSGKRTPEMGKIAARLASGELTGPRLFHSGLGFAGKGAHPVPYLSFISDNLPFYMRAFVPEIAIELGEPGDLSKVDQHLEGMPDFTKIYLDRIPDTGALMPDTLVAEVVKRSHARNVPVMFHIGSNDNLRSILKSGGDGAVHNVYKEALDPALAKELAARKIFVVPTVVAWHNYYLFVNKKSYKHYTALEYASMTKAQREALEDPHPESVKISKTWQDHDNDHVRYTSFLYPNVKVLRDAKVTILAGSDAPNYALALGGSLHTELQHLVNAGLTPTEALEAATGQPAAVMAKLFKRPIDFGTIEEGKVADLLLVQGDPTRQIADTQNIREVFARGTRVERKKME